MYGLGRGCTKLKATGMYSGVEKPVIMVIVSRRELNTLKTIVRERDPHAIVTVADVTEPSVRASRTLTRRADYVPSKRRSHW